MVKIITKDIKVYTSLAYLLDRDGVYEKMLEIRDKWKLNEGLIDVKQFDIWLNSPHPEIDFTESSANYYQEEVDKFDLENDRNNGVADIELNNKTKMFSNFNQIDFEVEILMREFGINARYKQLIIKAIVCGVVGDDDFKKEDGRFKYDFLLDDQKLRFVLERSYKGYKKIEIERDRKMYYENKFGNKTRYKISDEIDMDYDTAKKSFDRYRDFLNS